MRAPAADRQGPRALELTAVLAASFAFLALRRGAFGFWEDEGINLIKAMMVSEGFPLYRDVYSDHAPLFTWILVPFHRLFGGSFQAMGYVGVGFGALAFGAAYAIARWLGGPGAALASVALLTCLAPMQKFGSTILIVVPALAFASWSVYFALRAQGAGPAAQAARTGRIFQDRYAIASGALLGIAICTKLSFIYFLPVACLAIAAGAQPGDRLRPTLACLGAFALVVAVVLAFVDVRAMLPQLFADHLKALVVFREHTRRARVSLLLSPGLPLLYACAALLAGILAVRERRRAWPLVAWLGIVGVWIVFHRPLWPHHLPELLLPLSLMLGCGAFALARGAVAGLRSGPGRTRAVTALRLVPVALIIISVAAHVRSYRAFRAQVDNVTIDALAAFARTMADETRPNDWVIVDRPILAYLARRRVPPVVSMISEKRIRTGELTDADLVTAIDRYRPAAIAWTSMRFLRYVELRGKLAREYQRSSGLVAEGEFSKVEMEMKLFTPRGTALP